MPLLTKLYMGIDPGANGGLVVVKQSGRVDRMTVMPSSEALLWEWVAQYDNDRQVVALVEQAQSYPRQGIRSAFTYGWNYGGLRMALTAASISFQEVPPKEWQKFFRLAKKRNEARPAFKRRIRDKARQLFPRLKVWGKTQKVQLAVCDALLIAEYCRRTWDGR